jgi:hypothetical protein
MPQREYEPDDYLRLTLDSIEGSVRDRQARTARVVQAAQLIHDALDTVSDRCAVELLQRELRARQSS